MDDDVHTHTLHDNTYHTCMDFGQSSSVRLYDNLFFLLLRDVLLHTEHICKIAFVPASVLRSELVAKECVGGCQHYWYNHQGYNFTMYASGTYTYQHVSCHTCSIGHGQKYLHTSHVLFLCSMKRAFCVRPLNTVRLALLAKKRKKMYVWIQGLSVLTRQKKCTEGRKNNYLYTTQDIFAECILT